MWGVREMWRERRQEEFVLLSLGVLEAGNQDFPRSESRRGMPTDKGRFGSSSPTFLFPGLVH